MSHLRKTIIAAFMSLVCATHCLAAGSYMDMSLEDLMDLTVTSMSKRAQSLQDTAAAVTVLTNEDIRRSGATSIPEALRMVPGLMVGQNAANTWSISSRGRSFSPTFDNKLLVLIDGRSVYSPVFSGVFWETLDVVMEDIDRIEIIRGPGSSVWGANAVNGIINIITKSSADTQGLMASTLYGTEEKGTGSVRYGGKFNEDNTYRIYAKYRNLDDLEDLDGEAMFDDVESVISGFRADLTPDNNSKLTFQGNAYSGVTKSLLAYPDMTTNQMITDKITSDALLANVLGRYDRDLGNDHSISFQTYFSHDDRDSNAWQIAIDTLDFDFQHQFVPWKNHVAQWGLGYRSIAEENETNSQAVEFTKSSRQDSLYSAFLQDEITMGDWVLTLGSKFEHNDQTGWEFLPSARLLWHAAAEHTLWGAISRSVRTPSIAETDAIYHTALQPNPMYHPLHPVYRYLPSTIRVSMAGDDDVESETAIVYELGYRYSPSKNFYTDASFFVSQSDNLLNSAFPYDRQMQSVQTGELYSDTNNDVHGTTYGLELSANWVPVEWWKLQGWYSYCEDEYEYEIDDPDMFEDIYGSISPRHQFFLRSSFDMPYETELDIMGRYVSEIPGLGVEDYATVDVRLGWRPQHNVEISLVGKNLIEPRHLEAGSNIVYGSAGAVERSAFLKLRVDF